MKNISKLFAGIVTVFVLIVSIIQAPTAQAQVASTPVPVCPAGYTCTPVPPQPVDCPSGYICQVGVPTTPPPEPPIPVPVPTTGASVTVIGSPSLTLGYSSFKESMLTATFNVSISGGVNGIQIYKNYQGVNFLNETSGTNIVANSTISKPLVAISPNVQSTTDVYGIEYFVIPAGQTFRFKSVTTVNPQQMFAGIYHANLNSLLGAPLGSTGNNASIIPVSGNKTNSKTIIGERSPYITSITSPATVGQTVTIIGQRLNDTIVILDGQPQTAIRTKVTQNNTVLTFVLPKVTTNDKNNHYISLQNKTTGMSNQVWFEVGTPVSSFVDFLVVPTYSNGNQTVGIKASIKGDYRNKSVSKWTLDISCSTGVTMPAPNGQELCNSQQVYYGSNIYDHATTDYVVLTVDAYNKGSDISPNVKFVLTAYDASGSYGSDKEIVPLGFTNTQNQLITVIAPNGGEPLKNNTDFILKWTLPTDKRYMTSFYMIPEIETPYNHTDPYGIRGYDIGGTSLTNPTSPISVPFSFGGIPDGRYKLRAYLGVYNDGMKFNPTSAIAYDDSDSPFTIGLLPTPVTPAINLESVPNNANNPNSYDYIVTSKGSAFDRLVFRADCNDNEVEISAKGGMLCGENNDMGFTKTTQYSYPVIFTSKDGKNHTVGMSVTAYINGSIVGSDKDAQNVFASTYGNKPPVINGITAPTTLAINQSGTWTVQASDPEKGYLKYSVDWGDAPISEKGTAFTASVQNTSTFTHSYASAGLYTVKFQVTDTVGLVAETSSTVKVGDATNQSSVISATASLVSADKDVISGTFAPGGNYNKRVFSDWHWTVNLQGSNLGANEAKHIQSMTLYHALGGEGWSTSGSPNNDLGKGLYPLLVIGKGYQNTAYDQDIALSDLSQSNPNFSFDIWGQPESTRFYGGRLVIKFTDGTSVTAQIPSSTITPSTTTSTGAVWDSIRSLFGF